MKQDENETQHQTGIKKSVYLFSVIGVALLSIIGTFLIMKGPGDLLLTQGTSSSSSSVSPSTEGDFGAIEEVYQLLQQKYFQEVDKETLIEGAISGMAQSVGDPYTEFLDPDESAALSEDISGSFEGIGAEVMKEGDAVKIVSPIDDSPAAKAGLLPNDLVLSVDGESVSELSLTEAVSLIRGPKGSEVVLTIQRGDNTFEISLIRDSIPIETVKYQLDEENASVGYIKITNFSVPTYEEMVDAVTELRAQGATSFIFDVRGNPGGLLNVAIQLSNMFVEEGDTLLRVEERGEETVFYNANEELYGSFKITEPSVLLIDGGSASASEILAGAMNESGDIPLIGVQTFGKGTIQNIQTLKGSGELKMTIGKWLTPDGNWVNETGIQPTVEVELPEYVNLLLIDSTKTYTKGEASPEIANIKAVLNVLGYSAGEATEQYDSMLETTVQAFQKENGLEENGQVTGETSALMVEQLRALIEENDTQYEAAKDVLLEQ